MTLSLDDVRNKRFRMARKSGYEVLEVDEFVDEVEVAFEQLTDENQNLKKQIETLRATPAAEQAAPVTDSGPAEPETIVVTTGAEASSAVVRLVAMSTEQAERLVREATEEAATIRQDAAASARDVTGDAQARAERIQAEAQETADRVQYEAQSRAGSLDAEIGERRSQLLEGLHAERDELQVAVGHLRRFEETFRANLANELRAHVASLEARSAHPSEVPALADPAAVGEAERRASDGAPAAAAAAASAASAVPESSDAEAGSQASTGGAQPSDEPSGEGFFPAEDPAGDADGSPASDTPRLDALLGGDHR
jgi:DivIVA domain-containing protein